MHDKKVLSPPKAAETFKNVDVAQVRYRDGRRNRTKKPQSQFNTWVEPDFKVQMGDLARELSHEAGRDVPRGEILGLMYAAFQEQRGKASIKEALASKGTQAPPPDDAGHGRDKKLDFWASKDVAEALQARVKTHGWTLGAVIEDIMVKAARLVSLEKKL